MTADLVCESADIDGLVTSLEARCGGARAQGGRASKGWQERWILARALAGQARFRAAGPVRLWKGERPDFVLETRATRIGIEVTEAVTEAQRRTRMLVDRMAQEIGDAVLYYENAASLDGVGGPLGRGAEADLSLAAGLAPDRTTATPDPRVMWTKDSAERVTAEIVATRLKKKLAKRYPRERFDEFWIVCYENCSPVLVDIRDVARRVSSVLDAEHADRRDRCIVVTGTDLAIA